MARVSDQTIINARIRQGGVCAECGESLDESAYETHHLKRVANGGEHTEDNIVLLCDRDEHEFFHKGNFREPIETSPDQYPYYYGKKDHTEINEKPEAEMDAKIAKFSEEKGKKSTEEKPIEEAAQQTDIHKATDGAGEGDKEQTQDYDYDSGYGI